MQISQVLGRIRPNLKGLKIGDRVVIFISSQLMTEVGAQFILTKCILTARRYVLIICCKLLTHLKEG